MQGSNFQNAIIRLTSYTTHDIVLNVKRAYKRGGYRDGQAQFFYRVRLDGPLPGKNDNMAAMTLAVGVAYREIYSWKAAILYSSTVLVWFCRVRAEAKHFLFVSNLAK